MKVLGEEAISRSTRITGRTLIIIAATAIFYSFDWISTQSSSVLGFGISPENAPQMLGVLTFFAIASHVVQWLGDYLAFRDWEVFGQLAKDQQLDGQANPTLWDRLHVRLQEIAESERDDERAKRALGELEKFLELLEKRTRKLTLFSKFYVFGWYLSLPVAVGLIAIWRLLGLGDGT